jgi:hypothetical protein
MPSALDQPQHERRDHAKPNLFGWERRRGHKIIRGKNVTGMALFSVAAPWQWHVLFWNNAAWSTLPENYPRKENLFNTLVY